MSLHAVEMRQKVLDGLRIYLYHLEVDVLTLQQILGEDPHAGAYLEDVPRSGRGLAQGRDYGLRYPLVRQEMLPEGFLGSDFHAILPPCVRTGQWIRQRPGAAGR